MTRIVYYPDAQHAESVGSINRRHGRPIDLSTCCLPNRFEYAACYTKMVRNLELAFRAISGVDLLVLQILDKEKYNAVAAKLGTGCYYIGIRRGVIDDVLQITNNPSVMREYFSRVDSPSRQAYIQCMDCARYMALSFALYHELAHIIAGHLDLDAHLGRHGLIEEARMSGEALEGTENRLGKAVESDADCRAIRLLVANLNEITDGMHRQQGLSPDRALGYACAVTSLAIGLVFDDMATTWEGSIQYPSPSTRHFWAIYHLSDQMKRDGRWTDLVQSALAEGHSYWLVLARAHGWSTQRDDRDLFSWLHSIAPLVEELERLLPRCTPCRRIVA